MVGIPGTPQSDADTSADTAPAPPYSSQRDNALKDGILSRLPEPMPSEMMDIAGTKVDIGQVKAGFDALFGTLRDNHGITKVPDVDSTLVVQLDEQTFAKHFAVQMELDAVLNNDSDLTPALLAKHGLDNPRNVLNEILSPEFMGDLANNDPTAQTRLDTLLNQVATAKVDPKPGARPDRVATLVDNHRAELVENTRSNPARSINGRVLLNTGHLDGMATNPDHKADAIRHLLTHEFMHANSIGSDRTFSHRHAEGGVFSQDINPDEAMTELLAREITDALAERKAQDNGHQTPEIQYIQYDDGSNRYQANVDALDNELNAAPRTSAEAAFQSMLDSYFRAADPDSTPGTRPAPSSTDTHATAAPILPPPKGKDVITDESWRHDNAKTADWFAPSNPTSPDALKGRRDGAHVKTVNTVVADVTTDSTPSRIKSYQGLINYDLRRIEVAPGKFVQDYTVKVFLKPAPNPDAKTGTNTEAENKAIADAQNKAKADVERKAKEGVDKLLNQGFRLPSGDQFHLNLEFTTDPNEAHTVVEVGNTGTDQTHWNPNSSSNVLAHEVLHYLGVPDEYSDSTRVFLQRPGSSGVHLNDGGMMGTAVLGNDPGLRPRHLWLVERTANSQVAVPDTLLNDQGPTIRPPAANTPPATTAPAPNPNAAPPAPSDSRPAPSDNKRKRDDDGDVESEGAMDIDTDVQDGSKRPRTGDVPGSSSQVPSAQVPSTQGMDLDVDPVTGVTWDTDVNSPLDPPADAEMTDTATNVNGPVVDLQSDATTKFNDKFRDLAGGRPVHLPTRDGYLADLEANVENDKPVSFVVNAIVPISDIDAASLKNVIDRITADAKGIDGKVAFVIGVNTRGDNNPDAQAEVEAKLTELEAALADITDVPVALTGFTWNMPSTGNLPYGTMRNTTLDSTPSQFAISAFANNGNHPYVAVQDFDQGSRNVPSGQHIFNHVIDSMKGPDGLPPSRPLMISGGYRMPPDLDAWVADLEATRVAKIAKLRESDDPDLAKIEALEKAGERLASPDKFKNDFAREIAQDMDARVEQAKTSPMLPYTPEPNLFFDGVAPMVDPNVRFGDGGAEFSMLGRSLNHFFANEIGTIYDQKIADLDADTDVDMDADVTADDVDVADQRDAHLSQLAVDAQTYSHPIRTQAFISDFKGGAIETDLTRIALRYAEKGTVPQSHAPLGGVADRFFDTKDDKRGTSLGGFRDKFPKLAGINRDPTNLAADPNPKLNPNPELTAPPIGNPTAPPPEPSTAPQFKEVAKVVKDLGVGRGHDIDQSMSAPVPGHPGVTAGLDQSSRIVKTAAGVNTAMSGPEASMQRRFGAMNNIANLPSTRPPAPNGLYDAVGKAQGVDPAQLRDDVTGYVASLSADPGKGPGKKAAEAEVEIREQLADFITDHPTTNGDLVNSVLQPGPNAEFDPSTLTEDPDAVSRDVMAGTDTHPDGGPVESGPLPDVPDPAQVRADAESAANADRIAAQALATQLRTPIVVHHPSGPPTTYTPFGKDLPAVQPIEVDAVQGPNGRSTYTPHTAPVAGPTVVGTRAAPTPDTLSTPPASTPDNPGTRPAPTPDNPGTRPAPSPDNLGTRPAPIPDNPGTRPAPAPTAPSPATTTAANTAAANTTTANTPDPTTGTRSQAGHQQPAGRSTPGFRNLFSRSTPPPAQPPIPLVNVTPAGPLPAVLPGVPLPSFFQSNQALGSVAVNDVRGADQVTTAVNGLLPAVNGVAPQGVDRIGKALNDNFESFLGNGRTFQVQVGKNFYDANVTAVLNPVTGTGTASPAKVDSRVDSGATSTTTTSLTTGNDVSLNATASQGMGAYGTVGVKTTLSTPVTGNTSTTTALDDREVRGGDSSTKHDVPVTYRVTLTDAQGNVVGNTDVHDNGTSVALQVPNDLSNLANTDNTAGTVRPPDAEWGAKVEHLVPEAVTDIDVDQAFKDVAAKLHPSVTKPGADGRTVLRDFLSATNIRDNLHVMLNGWVTSPNLTSPHSAYGSAVQMKATLLDAELVGTHGGAQFRMHDTATTNTGVTATVGSGVEVNAAVGGGVGVPGVPVGAAGVTGSASAKTSETSSAGLTSVNRAGMQVGGQTGLYKVTANVEVRTPNGDTVTVPVTAHVRLGLPEATAHGLPVPANTQTGITKPNTENTRFEPPYLAEGLAAGNIRVGEFTAANQVQAQVENALKGLPGFDGFLPEWNRDTDPRADGKNFADVVEMLNNQRKLDAELSPTALRAKMDSLLGPGVQVQLKRQGFATNEFVNVTVKAKLGGAKHLGEADARQVRGLSSSAPKLDSATTTTKGWSAGVEGRGGANVKPGTASLTPTGNAAVKYSSTTADKTTAGPVVNDVALNVGDAKSQVFAHDIEFEVEITTFSRNQSWVKRMTPGSPLLQVPKEKTVVRTVDPKKLLDPAARDNPTILPQISGKVQLWVPDGSALKTPSADFKPGDPVDGTLPPNTTISTLLKPGATRPPRHEWLHVEAVANAEALRNGAIELVNASAGADGSLTVPGTEARNQIDKMFSPENLKANLRKMAETGLVTDSLRFDRRVTDRTGAIGMTVKFDKPKLVSISDTTPVETWTTGGFKAGDSVAHGQSVEGSAGVALGGKPNDTTPQGGGTFNAGAKWTPWSKTETTAREVGGNVDRKLVRPSGERTVLVQMDAEFSMVGESRSGNAIYKGTPHANGKTVTLPGGVFVRVSEQVARDMGLLEDVPPHTSPDHGSMRPPKRLNPGEPGGLGLGVVDDVPDLSPVVAQLATVVNQDTRGKLIPDSVLDDSMRNLQRLVDLTSPTSVKGLIDSAVDGGVPLLLHKPGTVIGKDTYQVTLRAKVGQPKFLEAVNDGRDMEHILAGSNKDSDALTKGTSWGVNARAGGQHLPDVQNGQSPAVGGAVGASLNFSQSKTTTDTTTELFGHKHTATGPAVRYEVPVEFELVVHKGDKEVGRVKADEAPITVRLHADNVRVDSPDVPDDRRPYGAEATSQPKDEASPAKIDQWLRDGLDVPGGASVEGMRGIQDIRMAAIAALERAGAGKGITGKGTGSLNSLLSTLSSETLQSMLPGMTKTPLEVPGLHEATLGKAQHASLKVYAKVVDTRLDSLSDGVKLENPTSTTHTTTSEAKHTQSGDVVVAPTGGVNKKAEDAQGNPDLVNSANSAFAFPEFKHTSDDSTADSGGPVSGTQQNLKPSGRTGLTESTIVYRFVADLGNGKVGVYDLTVPGSADLRMPVADVEAALGRTLPPELATAQDGVRDAAKAWRTAEAAVEVARHQAQDLLAERAGADIEVTNRETVLDTRSQEAETAFDALGPHDTAVDNARNARDTADTAVEDATTRAVDLDLASRRADKALGDAAEAVRTSQEGVELAEIQATAADNARARADQALRDAEAALGRHDRDNPPSADPEAAPDPVREGLVQDVKDATEVRDNRQVQQEKAAQDLVTARQEHQTALDRQQAAADVATDARAAADQAKTDLEAAERTATDAGHDFDAANDLLREARANARQAEQARQTAEREHQQAVRDRADLETRITDAQADLARKQDVADVRQASWWNAKTAADRQLAAFNAPPGNTPPAGTPATTATSSTNAPPPDPATTAPGPSSPSVPPPGVQTFGAPAATATSTFGAPVASGTPTASTSTPSTSTTPSATAQRDADAAALAARHQSERTAESNAVAARQLAEKQAASLALRAKQQAEYHAEGAALAAKLDAERLKAEAELLARQQQDRTNESNAFASRTQAERNRVAGELTANQQAHRQRVAAQVLANQELERNQVEAQIQQQLAVAPGSFDPNQVRQQVLNNQAAVQRNVEQQLDNEQAAERQRVEQQLLARQENDRLAAEHQLNQRQLAERQQAAQQLQLKQDAERVKAEHDLKARQLLEQKQAEAALDAKQDADRKAYEQQLNARQDAEHAAELAKWLPPGTKHFAAFADDNAAATWANTAYPGLATVNRTNFQNSVPGHDVNCTNCVIATHETLHGRPVAAPPLPAPAQGTYLENTFKSTFQTVGSYHEVVDYLAAQPGRHVSIGITRADGTGHVFNAWNDGGDLTFFDSQNHRPAKLERDAVKIEFIPLPDLPKPAPPPTTATAPPAAATPPTGPVP
ncbi:papain fold toxin 1 (glutamine deamidase) of polymorphic toxin system [Saccharothrix carnea]|uniref:Papain fold toxin 1 (Glutamine deamidase) of polymorphic toxin system n=1 Tax=Saccharothrix carnea TaxID=1280637 RepID=A0A2P8I858_SACCR|nr:toxin glutamine deamidase domain-containing protein [Saccharothrix carnea]PSL54620.1 papain fold toxin 1 (glutamine deamidase) of polymorphic toxin system [Saccharothrix carnea]